jgi:hypothetical protein
MDGFGAETKETLVSGAMTVGSVALAGADPPPDTLTEFTCGDVALAATLTVTAIDG